MSRYLTDCKWLFTHVPRTGGTWVIKSLDNLGVPTKRWWDSKKHRGLPMSHLLLSHYEGRHLKDVEGSFSFVRHPRTYYESVYKWLAQIGQEKRSRLIRDFRWHPHRLACAMFEDSFNRWVHNLLDVSPSWYTHLLELYVGPEGGEFQQFIGRTETLEDDFVQLCDILGINVERGSQLPIPTNRIDCRIDWETEALERMLHAEQRTISRFYSHRQPICSSQRRFFRPASAGTVSPLP